MPKRFLIVGSGFSGSVLAHLLAQGIDCTIDLWELRSHMGGNCHTERDAETGVMVHCYGPHIFHTDKKEIWDFINQFTTLMPYVHRVKAVSNGKVYPLPINLMTINQFFGKQFNPKGAKEFLEGLGDKEIGEAANFEEQALKFIGKELYDAFFYGYTKKQWGCEPRELPASILKRIPVRFNYDDNYHNSYYTGIPKDGYTAIMEKMIQHPCIQLKLNKTYIPGQDDQGYDHVFYTGPIDAFFNFNKGRLGYRTVTFEKMVAMGDYQGVSQMNYCDPEISCTRITEHKHFTPWENHEQTLIFKEFSKETSETDTPYYPKRLADDKSLLLEYRKQANELKTVSFLGRLATYRYMDMHQVIGEAMAFAESCLVRLKENQSLPIFPNEEI